MSDNINKKVAVIGGSGFVGSYICKELLSENYLVNIASRDPEKSSFLMTSGQIVMPILSR